MGKYVVKSIETEKVDKETGEVIKRTEAVSIIRKDAEPFFLTYSKGIMSLYGKTVFNVTTKVLWKLMEYAEYNTGKVYMTAERTEEIMQECGLSKSSYYRAIEELKKAGIITGGKSTFTIAENMFWKGDRKAREELKQAQLKVIFEPVYEADDKYTTIVKEESHTA